VITAWLCVTAGPVEIIAGQAITWADAYGDGLVRLEVLGARETRRCSRDPSAAAAENADRAGVADPGMFPSSRSWSKRSPGPAIWTCPLGDRDAHPAGARSGTPVGAW
jgi:hypothetical protein